MGEKLNVIWILVDAIRNYHSKGDELARLPVMDKLADDGIYFSQAVTSATSTSMSISSQMVGIPACYLSRNFVDFKYEPENFTTISRILNANGYNNYGISFAIDLRYRFHGIVDHVPKKYWPKGLPVAQPWLNDAVMDLFDIVVEGKLREPFFLFIHINGRRDNQVNDKVENILSKLSKYTSNSLFILNSDHGMPDRGKAEFHRVIEELGLFFNRHDLVMTDDNILIPLVIKYPNCERKRIKNAVSAIDIVPTILDLLSININPEWDIMGKSLVPLIENRNLKLYQERKLRTDTRYIAQRDRITSLRDSRYKYVFYRDVPFQEKELFYDLVKDPQESVNLINSEETKYKKLIQEFKREHAKQEAELIDFQKKCLSKKFSKEINNRITKLEDIREIVIFGREDYYFNYILYRIIKQSFKRANINYFIDLDKSDIEVQESIKFPFIGYKENDEDLFKKATINDNLVDIVFILVTSKQYRDFKRVIEVSNKLRPKFKFFFDYNLDFTRFLRVKNFLGIIKTALEKKEYYKNSPSQIMIDVKKVLKGNVGLDSNLLKYKAQVDKVKFIKSDF